ncbi:MAG: JAB domain-containing protein [Clostridiales bacterium]|nr:JAB domain-containing protein [Clostridiales bacterium]
MDKLQNTLDVVSIRLVENPPLYSDRSITTSEEAVELVAKELRTYDRELVCVINLSSTGRPISLNIVSMGSLNASFANPREVFKTAILCNAASIILMHNHPFGSLIPSPQDMKLTKRMAACGNLMGIPVLDHIIVGDGECFSFNDNDMMPDSVCLGDETFAAEERFIYGRTGNIAREERAPEETTREEIIQPSLRQGR